MQTFLTSTNKLGARKEEIINEAFLYIRESRQQLEY